MAEAHIVPELAHASLISTRKFCDAGCKVVFDMQGCRIYYNNKLVLTGDRDPMTALWRLPINPVTTKRESTMHIASLDLHQGANQTLQHDAQIQHAANNVYTLPYKQNQLKYMHQTFFNPPITTLIDAIQNSQLEGIPCMKADLIRKYLAPSPATPKGRMKRPRAGIHSTRTKKHQSRRSRDSNQDPSSTQDEHQNLTSSNANVIPSDETHEVNNVFCFAALTDKQTGTE